MSCKKSSADNAPPALSATKDNKDNKENNDFALKKRRSLFGRRIGKKLSRQKKEVIENFLPQISLPSKYLNLDGSTHPQAFFKKNYKSFWLEIGFGYGEHLSGMMEKQPETAFIGAEPFVNGMADFLVNIENKNHDNVRVLMDDAMIIARSLAPQTLDGIYVLNPDPWHKTRHHKRRIINQHNLDIFSYILKPEGELIMTTDVEDLAQWMVTQATIHPDFEWSARSAQDWKNAPHGWIPTRYESKGAKNSKQMCYLIFRKK